jgi:hypothetical protein
LNALVWRKIGIEAPHAGSNHQDNVRVRCPRVWGGILLEQVGGDGDRHDARQAVSPLHQDRDPQGDKAALQAWGCVAFLKLEAKVRTDLRQDAGDRRAILRARAFERTGARDLPAKERSLRKAHQSAETIDEKSALIVRQKALAGDVDQGRQLFPARPTFPDLARPDGNLGRFAGTARALVNDLVCQPDNIVDQ